MKRKIVSILFALLIVMMVATPVLAAGYSATVTVSETGTASYNMLGVSASIDNDNLADNNIIESTALDTRMLLGTSELPHLPADDRVNFALPIEENNQYPLEYTTGNDDLTSFQVVSGNGGYVGTQDASGLEPSTSWSATSVDTYLEATAASAGASTTVEQTTVGTQHNLYNGSYIRSGQRVTGVAHISSVSFRLMKTNNPTGTGYVRVYDANDNTLLGTIDSIDVTTLTTGWLWYDFDTTPLDITTQTDVMVVFEYDDGNSSNYVSVSYYHTADITSFGYLANYNEATSAWGYVVDDDSVFKITYKPYSNMTVVEKPGALKQWTDATGMNVAVSSGFESGTSSTTIRAMWATDSYVYAGDTNGNVHQYRIEDLILNATASTAYGGQIWSMWGDDTYLYVVGATTQTIRKYQLSDLTYVGESVSYGGDILGIWGDDTHLYITGSTTVKIRKYLKDLTYVAESPTHNWPAYDIWGDDTHLYIPLQTGNVVRKYLKSDMTYVSTTASLGALPYAIWADTTASTGYFYVVPNAAPYSVHKYSKDTMAKVAESKGLLGTVYYGCLRGSGSYLYAAGGVDNVVHVFDTSTMVEVAESYNFSTALYTVYVDSSEVYVSGSSQYPARMTVGPLSSGVSFTDGEVSSKLETSNAVASTATEFIYSDDYSTGTQCYDLAYNDDYVFWGRTDNYLYRADRKDFGSPTGYNAGIAIYTVWADEHNGDSIVYMGYNGGIRAVNVSDMTYSDAMAYTGTGVVYAIWGDEDYVYFGGTTTNKVEKADKATLTSQGQTIVYSGTAIQAIWGDDTYLYVGGTGGVGTRVIDRFNKSTLAYVDSSADYGGHIYGVWGNDTYVFAGGTVTQTVRQYLKSDMSYVGETASYGGDIQNIRADNTYLYATGSTTQRVRQYNASTLAYLNQTNDGGGAGYGLTVTTDGWMYCGFSVAGYPLWEYKVGDWTYYDYYLKVYVEDVLQDTATTHIPIMYWNNSNDWVFGANVPYWESFTLNIDASDVLKYQPASMIRGRVYSTGTVTVTNGDATVEGSGTTWTDYMVGSAFVSADGLYYVVDSVTDADTLELTTNYAGSTLAAQSYNMYVRLPDEIGDYEGEITWGSNPTGITVAVGALLPTTDSQASVTAQGDDSSFVPETDDSEMLTTGIEGENLPFYGLIKGLLTEYNNLGGPDIPMADFWKIVAVVIGWCFGTMVMIMTRNVIFGMIGYVLGFSVPAFSMGGMLDTWIPIVYGISALCLAGLIWKWTSSSIS